MISLKVKKILTLLSVSIAVIAAFAYLGSVELKIKNIPAQADEPPKLQKEVINIAGNNILSVNNTANPGDRLKYRLTYSNPGAAELLNVKLLDVLPSNTVLATVTDNGVYSTADNSVSWIIPRIANGGTGIVNYEVKINAIPDQTIISNTAYLTASAIPQGIKSNEVKTTVSAAMITIEASADKTSAKRGDKIIYTVNIKNAGGVEAQAVKARDVMPTEVSFLESNTTPASIEGNIIEFNLGNLAPGAAKTVTVTASIGKNAAPDSTIINNIIINYSDKNNIIYPDVLKAVSASIGTGTATTAGGEIKKDSPAPKTGGNIAVSLAISLFLGIAVTLLFYYKHEPLSFAGAKVSILSSREKINTVQKNYFSGGSLKLKIESLKIKLKRMIA